MENDTTAKGRSFRPGDKVGILFTYSDGTTYKHGSWVVPKKSNEVAHDEIANGIGWTILHEMLRSSQTRTLISVEIKVWEPSGKEKP